MNRKGKNRSKNLIIFLGLSILEIETSRKRLWIILYNTEKAKIKCKVKKERITSNKEKERTW